MRAFLISTLAVIAFAAAFVADAVAAYPPNDWQRVSGVVPPQCPGA